MAWGDKPGKYMVILFKNTNGKKTTERLWFKTSVEQKAQALYLLKKDPRAYGFELKIDKTYKNKSRVQKGK